MKDFATLLFTLIDSQIAVGKHVTNKNAESLETSLKEIFGEHLKRATGA